LETKHIGSICQTSCKYLGLAPNLGVFTTNIVNTAIRRKRYTWSQLVVFLTLNWQCENCVSTPKFDTKYCTIVISISLVRQHFILNASCFIWIYTVFMILYLPVLLKLPSARRCFSFYALRWFPVANSTIQNRLRVYELYEPGQ